MSKSKVLKNHSWATIEHYFDTEFRQATHTADFKPE